MGQPVEGYQWLDFVRLAGFHDGESGYEFTYNEGERTPFAMRRNDGAIAGLFYDQVGSLRAVADLDNNVIKEVLYDPFGGIIKDTNPGLRIPIGFAGGLHDRDLGFVRFGWRDYDTYTGRWTAPDPIGDRGGDSDWYGYCLDDPINGVDPQGLEGSFDAIKRVQKKYYKVYADPGACEKCLSVDGVIFKEDPTPIHPNCRCGTKEVWLTDEEAAEFFHSMKPPLLQPNGSKGKAWAKGLMKDKLEDYAEDTLDFYLNRKPFKSILDGIDAWNKRKQ